MSGIRLADVPDVAAICELGRELLAESVYDGIPADEQKFRRLVAGMIGSSSGLVLLVVDDDDSPQGFLLGMLDELFYSRKRIVTDLAIWIRDGWRHLGPRLIRHLDHWGQSKPRTAGMLLGISSGIGDLERVGKMYEAIGLAKVGGIYFKRYGSCPT